jgi:hypothetical protein
MSEISISASMTSRSFRAWCRLKNSRTWSYTGPGALTEPKYFASGTVWRSCPENGVYERRLVRCFECSESQLISAFFLTARKWNELADASVRHDRSLITVPACVGVYRMLTARAARSAMISSESSDCNIIKTLAHRAKMGASVGEKAVLVLKARNR